MGVIILASQLRPETLRALIEEFVTRDGTRYGHREATLEEMVGAVEVQLKSGEVVIVFDDESESCTMMGRGEWVIRERARERLAEGE